jgi:hypothetical protein
MKKTLLALALLPALALSACTATSNSDEGQDVKLLAKFRGVVSSQISSEDSPAMHWTSKGKTSVGLTYYGSGSCPIYPTKIKVEDSTRVLLTMKTYDGACTADLAPFTSEFELPANVSRSEPVHFQLDQNLSPTDTFSDTLTLRPNSIVSSTKFVAPTH